MEFRHRPVEKAQGLTAFHRVFGNQRMLGMHAFKIIYDGPNADDDCSVHIDQQRQMFLRIVGRGRIVSQALLAQRKADKTAGRRHENVGKAAHGVTL